MFAKNLLVALVASFVAVSVAAPTPEAAPDAVEKREVETPGKAWPAPLYRRPTSLLRGR